MMDGEILVLNAGSSSIKFSVFAGAGELVERLHGEVEGLGPGPERLRAYDAEGRLLVDLDPGAARGAELTHQEALGVLLDWLETQGLHEEMAAAGHRVVHGGTEYAGPVRVDATVLERLEALVPLAPLHQPHNLAAIRALARLKPGLPQIACFDTAFHRGQPPVAQAFALPREITAAGVRRYGFHGLSYEYIASVLPAFLGEAAEGRVIVAHLGNGVSLCALRARRSVATSMGFTALEGPPMGTRCGTLDPGVVLHLLGAMGMDLDEVTDLLYRRSGLLGVSGISNDMRVLLGSSDPRAAEAIDLFVYRIGRELGSLAAALGGLDAVVFTAGIGEHAVPIRARIGQEAAWLGLRLDEDANRRGGPRISADSSPVSAWVIPTDEERMIARHTRGVLGRLSVE